MSRRTNRGAGWSIAVVVACVGGALGEGTGGPAAEPAVTNGDALIEVRDSRLFSNWASTVPDTVSAGMDTVPGLLVNRQGGVAGLADLSIRGSSFSGAGLSVGGLALRNPQTEHFQAELPMPASLFKTPTIRTGLDQCLHSSGHLVGSVDLDLLPVGDRAKAGVGAGTLGTEWEHVSVEQVAEGRGDSVVGLGFFGGRYLADELDYPDNSIEARNVGGRVQWRGDGWQIDGVGATQEKSFGARGYYGVSPDWAAEEALRDYLVLGSGQWNGDDDRRVRITGQWRETRDEYRLFMDSPGVYENRHRTRVTALGAETRQPTGLRGVMITARAAADEESIDSDRLGDHERVHGQFLLLPEVARGPLTVWAGGGAHGFTDEEPVWVPAAGLRVALGERHELFSSYTAGVRQPSYTELSYDSPGSLGDAGLRNQRLGSWEAGWSGRAAAGHSVRVTGFHHTSRHTVDWVKATEDTPRWVATDVGDVETLGAEFFGSLKLGRKGNCDVSYQWLDRSVDMDFFAGRYVADIPKHVLHLAADWRMTERLVVAWAQELRWYHESAYRSDGFSSVGSRLEGRYQSRRFPGLELLVACDNVWDDGSEFFPGQPVSERRIVAGLSASAW